MFMSAYAFNYKDAADRYIQILHETKQHIKSISDLWDKTYPKVSYQTHSLLIKLQQN